MKPEVTMSITLTTVAIFLLFAVFGTLYYELKTKNHRLAKKEKGDWLFSDIHKIIFDMVYGKSTSEKLCGIDRTEYLRQCKIIHQKPDLETMVAMRLEAVIIAFALCALGVAMSYSLIAELACMALAALAFYALWMLPTSILKNKVSEKLFYVSDDLPRFLALLEKAMDLPIDQAMIATAMKFDSPLSEDLIDSINKVSLGANGWQETLLELARTYDIEDFSDLTLEIINSYEQGVNIRPIVNRKAYEVEQNRMYAVESHDAKIKTMIFLPIIALKVLPLMVLVCLPMAQDIL